MIDKEGNFILWYKIPFCVIVKFSFIEFAVVVGTIKESVKDSFIPGHGIGGGISLPSLLMFEEKESVKEVWIILKYLACPFCRISI